MYLANHTDPVACNGTYTISCICQQTAKLLDITQPKVITLSAAPCGMRVLFNAKEIGEILIEFKTGYIKHNFALKHVMLIFRTNVFM